MSAVTTLSVALGGCLLATSVVAATGQVATGRAAVDTAADLAALAAAASLAEGGTQREACERAEVLTSHQQDRRVVLVSCRALGRDVSVEVSTSRPVLGVPVTVRGTARAGRDRP